MNMDERKEKAASPGRGEAAEQTQLRLKRTTKLERIEAALKLPEGLNRFEAQRLGDSCLNSTAAVLRTIYGSRLVQRWEVVPSRFCTRGVRCLRYWIV